MGRIFAVHEYVAQADVDGSVFERAIWEGLGRSRLGPCTGVLLRTLNNSYPLFKLRLYHFPSLRTVIISCFW